MPCEQLAELVPDAILVHNGSSIVYANTAALNMFGAASAEQLLGRAPLDIVHPDFKPLVAQRIRHLLEGGQSTPRIDQIGLRLDGSAFDMEASAASIMWEGQPAMLVVIRDITERKRLEQQVHEQGELLQRLNDSNIIGIIHGEDEVITGANDAFLKMIGYSRDDLRAKSLWWPRLTPPEHLSADENARAQLSATGICTPFEKEYIRKDGSRVPILLGIAQLGGPPVRWIGFVMDLTVQKRAEKTLSAVAEHALNGIITIDQRGLIQSFNPAAERIFGYSAGEVAGQNVNLLMPEPYRNMHATYLARATAADAAAISMYREVVALRKDGTVFPADLAVSAFDLDHGRFFVGIVRDITERKQMAADLMEAYSEADAANRAKDKFLAVLSHELRTPLTPVLTAVQMMEEDTTLPLQVREWTSMIRRNVELETRLIDDMLDLTRISRGKLELHMGPVDLHELLQHVVRMCESDLWSKGLRLTRALRAAEFHVQGDEARLQQVFWNLLKNAIKFTSGGGEISIRSENAADGVISVVVQDTGAGIDAEVLPRIFDAFEQGGIQTTRRFGGLGLGLAISKGIVDLHGGTLAAQSEGHGQGSTFTVSLLTARIAAKVAAKYGGGATAKPRGRILLVEDHADTAKSLTMLLIKTGYDVYMTHDVASALHAAEAEPFDILISDVGLPDGSGLDLMRQLSRHRPINGIALSGYGMEEDVVRSREAGFAVHLTKPPTLKMLRDALSYVSQLS
jgi:PAS domain S-box-containing protein